MIKWNFKKILTSALTVLGIGTLTSCYGMPANGLGCSVFGNVSSENASDGISGIKVTLKDGDKIIASDVTNASGNYDIMCSEEYSGRNFTLEFSDIDGNENGAYENQQKTITLEDSYKREDVVLNAK